MLLNFFTNRWVLMVICAVLTFGLMFPVKKWFTSWTPKIKNVKVKTAVNVVLGLITSFVLAAVLMWALCDIFGAVFYWKLVIASTLGATLIYLILEKIFGNAVVNKLGNDFANYISHSDLFDGKITDAGALAVAQSLFDRVNKADKAIAEKEGKAIEEVLKRLDGFIEDGQVTAEEKVAATELINNNNIDVNNSTYEKYRALLNK